MFRLGSGPQIHIRVSASSAIDFCVWVLLIDGLRVPSFDQHPDGSGVLRAAGLDTATWQAWIAYEVRDLQETMALANEALPPTPPYHISPELRDRLAHGSGSWHLPVAVEREVAALRSSYPKEERQFAPQKPTEHSRGLWRRVKPYLERTGQRAHHFYPVRYPVPTYYVLPPASAIIGTSDGHDKSEEAVEAMVAAAAELARLATT